MLKEMDFNDLKQTRIDYPDAYFYIISRDKLEYVKFAQIQDCAVLAPSEGLARDLRLGEISPVEFKNKYTRELRSPIVRELLRYINRDAQNQDVYLVKDPRFTDTLLLDMLGNIK